ncbi:MAG TPA: hypothetical protein DCZ94_20355 [Lentisphaeria bacterium]|nr:hypothetical protein [Lentisphaeria bacterium]
MHIIMPQAILLFMRQPNGFLAHGGLRLKPAALITARYVNIASGLVRKIVKEIRMAHKAKQSLNSNYIQKNNKPLYMATVKRFKNWGSAVKAAGIDYDGIRLRRKMSRSDVKREILELYRRKIDLAYPNMRRKYQYLLASGMKKLGNGSWVKARKRCGIKINYRLPRKLS